MSKVHDLPAFQALRRKRARLSWGLALPLVGAYIVFGLACVWLPDAMGAPIGSDPYITWALIIAYALIGLSIVAAIVYVRVSNHGLEAQREALVRELNHD